MIAANANSDVTAHTDLFRVTLLGTGTPNLDIERFGASTLVEAGDLKLLFDAGRGASIRLSQLKIPLARLDTVFLTHYHSDHTNGLPDLWLTGWLGTGGSRKEPFQLVGPVGAKSLAAGLEVAYSDDIKIRASENFPMPGIAFRVDEFSEDGVVYENNGVKVTAFTVKHGDVTPAVGYRIDYKGRAVVLSGDTNLHPNVVRYGAGVDLLIHEVLLTRPEVRNVPVVKYVMSLHTTPQQAGEVFKATQPKMAAFTHVGCLGRPATDEEFVQQTRETYHGPLEVGADLMSFEIGENVKVVKFSR